MKRHLIVALGVALLATPTVQAQAQAQAETARTGPLQTTAGTSLPVPTGKYPVGLASLHLVDTDRPDPWVPQDGPRQLMVSLWYPATKAGTRAAPYVTPQESALIVKPYPNVPADTLAKTRTYATVDAKPLTRSLPLVLVSPGFSFPRATMTSLAEDLAGKGYLVAAVEHTYESAATTFPDGRTTTCAACAGENTEERGAAIAKSRVIDLSFVLDRLTAKSGWGRLVDRSRIGVVGFSAGGNAAPQLMAADKRVRAGVNLDGSYNPKQPTGTVRGPLLMMGTKENHTPAGDVSWVNWWSKVNGWKRWLSVADTDHASFTDYAVIRPQVGLPAPALDGERAVSITRTYVGAFLDRHLRQQREPLLDKPSKDFPEVTFWPEPASRR
ncbi:alpha/beta hydrolase family protein [Nonomuraea sp. NPDC049028]|uniref:alpha/beta hydrolase family protein n=1 Tax=Nonomuraea sp. NPDC049028 TaxID=3364348 RepID=UPI0037237E27